MADNGVLNIDVHSVVGLVQRSPLKAVELELEGYFSEIQEEFINERHALLPDIQHSGKWKEILHSLQTESLRIPLIDRNYRNTFYHFLN